MFFFGRHGTLSRGANSDLAPIDLLIQRAGRLWRHRRQGRPVTGPEFMVLSPEASDAAVAGWPMPALPRTHFVYQHRGVLWRTARVLFSRGAIVTEEVRTLIEAV